jgi:phenylalanyl-tRNA synthetase beta chain
MRISLNWLKQYVEVNKLPEELAHSLTMLGFEVESIEYLGNKYRQFVVGKVVDVQKHPKADKLTVCQVDIGTEKLQIVCGAPNVANSQIVAIGLADAIVPKNQHDPDGKSFKLSKVSLRGVESNGMICSEYELDLGDDKDGILILDNNASVGTPLSQYLGVDDVVFEIGVTPNRPDGLSHIGIARELASQQNTTVKFLSTEIEENGPEIFSKASVKVEDSKNCPRYSARLISEIKVTASPDWLQKSLAGVGIRPINNIVDVTNYVLMECGQPLHAFDYDKLTGGSIIVKPGKENQSFITLDHKERKLLNDTLMICDSQKPIAIAGIMGGENSEISKSTSSVLIESAYFSPRSIRRTSKHFGLISDASQRFERGADPNITVWALNRAAGLIQSIAGGKIARGILDVYPNEIKGKEIVLRTSKVSEILGITLTKEIILDILSKLSLKIIGFENNGIGQHNINVCTPTFRPDLEIEIDLIEEIARVYGYDSIPIHQSSLLKFSEIAPTKNWIPEFRNYFIGAGMREIVTNSMQNISTASLASEHPVKISNPISRDMEALRTSLIPNMLEVIRENIFRGTTSLRLFEFGNTYFNDPALTGKYIMQYQEIDKLTITLTGSVNRLSWGEKVRYSDIFDIKGEIESFFEKIFLDNIKFIPYPTTNALSESGLRIEINGEYTGTIGLIRKDILKRYEIEQDVVFADIEIDPLVRLIQNKRVFSPLPKFPSIVRDIALIVDRTIEMTAIEAIIKKSGSSLLQRVELFDRYIGEQIDESKISYAFTLEFFSEDHTLTLIEVDKVIDNITTQLEKQLKAAIRR